MWDRSWLRSRSFWAETGLFLFFILLLILVTVIKPTGSSEVITSTPTLGREQPAFYYSETDPVSSITKIRKSTTADVNVSNELAVFSHASGSLPVGDLSPDGTRIALIIPPKAAVDISNGELWLLQTDGTYFQRTTSEPCSWIAWKQDSQEVALFYQNTGSTSSYQSPSLRTRLTKLNLKANEISLIQEDNNSLDVKPLGWATGGAEFVLMSLSTSGKWSVSSIKMDNGTQIERFSLPEKDLLRNAWLSPNGTYLLMDIIRNAKALLMLFSLDGRQQVEIASLGVGLFSNPPPFTAIWSPDGQRLLVNQPSASLSNTTWKTYDLNGALDTPIFLGEVDPNHYLRPLDWSPDGMWLAMAESPFPYARIYIKEITAADRLLIPLENSNNWVSWLGWSPD